MRGLAIHLAALLLLAGCAGSRAFAVYTGVCAEKRTACQARCVERIDPRPCEDRCDNEGSQCQTHQGTKGLEPAEPP